MKKDLYFDFKEKLNELEPITDKINEILNNITFEEKQAILESLQSGWFKKELLRSTEWLVMTFYKSLSENPKDKVIIVAMWAPWGWDAFSLKYVDILAKKWYDVLVPEYYGFMRSSWYFSPWWVIRTLIDSKKLLEQWEGLESYYSNKQRILQYRNPIFIWSSFGGCVVSMLPYFDRTIKKIGLISPVLEFSSLWEWEETVESFWDVMNNWWKNIYKWVNDATKLERDEHFDDNSWLIPTKNFDHFKDVQLFLAHGTLDESIKFEKSEKFIMKLRNRFPNGDFTLLTLVGGKHSDISRAFAMKQFLDRFENK